MRILGLKIDISEKSGLVSIEIESEHDTVVFQVSAEAAHIIASDLVEAANMCKLFEDERRAERES